MEKENLIKQLKAITKWSNNLQQNLESVEVEIDQEEKEALASISNLIFKKAKAVQQALGGEDPTKQESSSATQNTVSKLQDEVEKLYKVNRELEEAQKQAYSEISDLHNQLDELKIQKESSTREEYEMKTRANLRDELEKSKVKYIELKKVFYECQKRGHILEEAERRSAMKISELKE